MSAPEIRVVTEEEEAARTYSIFDVVLPVIDSAVQCVLPQNSVGRFVKRLVKDDGMGALLKGHNATQRCHFRALVARATDLTFRLAAYARRDADLTPHMVDAVRLCAIYICIYISIYIYIYIYICEGKTCIY